MEKNLGKVKLTTCFDGLKSRGLEDLIRLYAKNHYLELSNVSHKSHWLLWETVFFTIEGDIEDIVSFYTALDKVLK